MTSFSFSFLFPASPWPRVDLQANWLEKRARKNSVHVPFLACGSQAHLWQVFEYSVWNSRSKFQLSKSKMIRIGNFLLIIPGSVQQNKKRVAKITQRTSLGSSQILRFPQFKIEAARRFCNFNDTIDDDNWSKYRWDSARAPVPSRSRILFLTSEREFIPSRKSRYKPATKHYWLFWKVL